VGCYIYSEARRIGLRVEGVEQEEICGWVETRRINLLCSNEVGAQV
jgi:hypothetical protein